MNRPDFVPTKDYLCNYIINRIPFHKLRVQQYRKIGIRIGAGSTIFMSNWMHEATSITVGEATVINPHCHLDGRGGLKIGNNVNISSHVVLVAGSHDIQDGKQFGGYAKPIEIEDYVWLCTRCIILAGVTVGYGAVVAAGAVVTRSVEPYTVVAGVPAVKIGDRNQDLHYNMADCGYSWQ